MIAESTSLVPAPEIKATAIELTEEILRILPDDGASMGNGRIKALLACKAAVSDEAYDEAKNKLVFLGVVRSGRGRGGSLARVVESAGGKPEGDAQANEATPLPPTLFTSGNGTAQAAAQSSKPRQTSIFDAEQPRSETYDISGPHFSEQIITYIGNKRSLLHFIGNGLNIVKKRLGKERLKTFDVFSGSGVVARFMKGFSEHLSVCDIEEYSAIVNSCYLSNRSEVDDVLVRKWIDRMNQEGQHNPIKGFVADLYAPQDDDNIKAGERVFYTQRNARFIDTARRVIDDAPLQIRNHLLAPLLYVASVHANTSGVFKGFYKNSETGIGQFGGNGKDALTRICKPFTIPYPIYSEYESAYSIYTGDSNHLAKAHPHVDVAYLDPPYNQHPYGSNYFMLNLIAKCQRPTEISDVSGIPTDWNRSSYNKKPLAKRALFDLAKSLDAKFLLISFNSEGFITKEEMVSMLNEIGKTEVLETAYNTFRGSRNLSDRETYVTEYLYLVEKT